MLTRDPDAQRRFFLAGPPEGGRARLLEEDEQHALRVLRIAEGDALIGLDGRGGAWQLEVSAARKRTLELEVREALDPEPAPGEPGAPLPWIEIWLPLPKAGRAEEMVDRLTQLGAARIAALATERTAPHAREAGERRIERLQRRAREACKQSGRRWLPQIEGPAELKARLSSLPADARLVCLDPRGESPLARFLTSASDASRDSARRATILALGPEGGWSSAEEQRLEAAGAARVRLTPYILRIETAAEAACAMVAIAATQ